jgi:hypothetical protein
MGKTKVKEIQDPKVIATDNAKSDNTRSPEAEMEDDDSEVDVILDLDSEGASDVFDFMEPADPMDLVSRRSEEDDESEPNQEPFISPTRIARKLKVPKAKSSASEYRLPEERETEVSAKSRWLLTTCRYCFRMYRFRSDEPEPLTCGAPQCLEKFRERQNSKKSA